MGIFVALSRGYLTAARRWRGDLWLGGESSTDSRDSVGLSASCSAASGSALPRVVSLGLSRWELSIGGTFTLNGLELKSRSF